MLKPVVTVGGSIAVFFIAREYTILASVPWLAFLIWWLNREVYDQYIRPSKNTMNPILDSVFGKYEIDNNIKKKESNDEISKDS